MSQLDQDWQTIKQELVDLKTKNAQLESDNAVLKNEVPSDQTVTEMRSEAASVVPPQA